MARVVRDGYRIVWTPSAGARLYTAFGILILGPFGLLVSAATVSGVVAAADALPHAYHDGTGAFLAAVATHLFAIAFGAFLSYALLRHGVGTFADALGARRTIEGEVSGKRVDRAPRSVRYLASVAERQFETTEVAHALLHEGAIVRVVVGRFERQLHELAVPLTASQPIETVDESKLS